MTNSISVVAAVQSPTLLNILGRSNEWSFRVMPLGDHEGLQETSMLTVPVWDPRRDQMPEIVLVCSPEQYRRASRFWPDAKLLWVIHNGYQRQLLPREFEGSVAGAVCFSSMVAWLASAGRDTVPFHFISPVATIAGRSFPPWSEAAPTHSTARTNPQALRQEPRRSSFCLLAPGFCRRCRAALASGWRSMKRWRRACLSSADGGATCAKKCLLSTGRCRTTFGAWPRLHVACVKARTGRRNCLRWASTTFASTGALLAWTRRSETSSTTTGEP